MPKEFNWLRSFTAWGVLLPKEFHWLRSFTAWGVSLPIYFYDIESGIFCTLIYIYIYCFFPENICWSKIKPIITYICFFYFINTSVFSFKSSALSSQVSFKFHNSKSILYKFLINKINNCICFAELKWFTLMHFLKWRKQ